ncbi:1,4-dihydroxy-2-naphthoate polyprenyltransferase [soil metagenome]
MSKSPIKLWLSAFRLRTLPLALSTIFMGSFLAANVFAFRWSVFALAVTTTLFLQILSNLANDYGDTQHGADSEGRVGPMRAVQSGAISLKDMRTAMGILAVLALTSGVALLMVAFTDWVNILLFLGLGLAAIAAAVKYTAGKNPYGYRGMGDVFVFIFFGLIGTAGTYFLYTSHLEPLIFLPAISMGCLSTGVLNLNNLRDHINDKKAGKITMVVRLGFEEAKRYHRVLIITAFVAALLFTYAHYQSMWQLAFLLSGPIFLTHLREVAQNQEPALLDPQLKVLALSTLLFSLLFGFGLYLST